MTAVYEEVFMFAVSSRVLSLVLVAGTALSATAADSARSITIYSSAQPGAIDRLEDHPPRPAVTGRKVHPPPRRLEFALSAKVARAGFYR